MFLDGAYVPLACEGWAADHVIGFLRSHRDTVVAAIVPRLAAELSPRQVPLGEAVWRDTALAVPPSAAALAFRDLFTGRSFAPDRDRRGRATLQVGRVHPSGGPALGSEAAAGPLAP